MELTTDAVRLDLSNAAYHERPALSSTGAKLLIAPNVPADYIYYRQNPMRKAVFDFGSGAHDLLLGTGSEIDVIEYASWQTDKAKALRAESWANNRIPMLAKERALAAHMTGLVPQHRHAGRLLAGHGVNEFSVFHRDDETGVDLRVRPDRLTRDEHGPIVVDYKTTAKETRSEFKWAARTLGYHVSAAMYLEVLEAEAEAVEAATGIDPTGARFMLIVQSKTAPYRVWVSQYGPNALALGHLLYREAVHTFATCSASDEWPEYDDIDVLDYPFTTNRTERIELDDDL